MDSLTRKLGPTAGLLGAADRELARQTIRSLAAASEEDLRLYQASKTGEQDPRDAAHGADLLRTAVLWKAVEESLDAGNYWLGSNYPSALPRSTPGTHFQSLTVIQNGQQSAAVFFMEGGARASELRSVGEYHRNQRLFWLHEAARLFNGRPDAERQRLYEAFEGEKAKQGYDRVGADLRAIFPFENRVSSRGYLMFAPM
jgi:hypothetical protein